MKCALINKNHFISTPAIVLFYMPLVFISLFISCEQSVSPTGAHSEKYILYCAINCDTAFQKAYLSGSYTSSTYNPLDNTADPSIEGAQITLTVNGKSVYYMSEAEAPRSDTSRYTTPLKYYYLNNYKPEGLDSVEITATLPNGYVLKSSAIMLSSSGFFNASQLNGIYCNPSLEDPVIMFWTMLDYKYYSSVYFYGRLDILYYKADNPDVIYKARVPSYYYYKDGRQIAVYPALAKSAEFNFYSESIKSVLESISSGDADKSNYVIKEAEHTLFIIDKNIGGYILADETFNGEFSVRIDAADYTNIENGIGVFGAYCKRKCKVKFIRAYISDFGYLTSY